MRNFWFTAKTNQSKCLFSKKIVSPDYEPQMTSQEMSYFEILKDMSELLVMT